MDKEVIRLECLKLGHRADRQPAEVVHFAKEFEKYVLGDASSEKKLAPKREKKQTDNPEVPT